MNSVSLIGNLVDAPELRFTNSGTPVATFRIAVDAAGKSQMETGYFDCVCWRQVAEAAADTLVKGMKVQLTAELRQDRWEKQDGTERSRIFVLVSELSLPLPKPGASANGRRTQGAASVG